MPELPEVETIVNDLRPLVEGKSIKHIDFLWSNALLYPSIDEFHLSVDGRKIESISRRGKYIIFNLDNRDTNKQLVMHLRMTGSLLWKTTEDFPKHTRIIIEFSDGCILCFIDPRKFGKVMLSPRCSELDKLGIEPFDTEFTEKKLQDLLKDKKSPIKTILLNQEIIAGIGNMYADEALYESHIDPSRPACTLHNTEIILLKKAIINVLSKGIEAGGASVSDYFRPNGLKGHAHEAYKVAHKKNGKCEVCGNKILRKVVGQRGTYYCGTCQK